MRCHRIIGSMLVCISFACGATPAATETMPKPRSAAAPAASPPQPNVARVADVVPEGCSVIAAIAGHADGEGEDPNAKLEVPAKQALAVAAAALGGQLAVPSGLGHSSTGLTLYGHAFRCSKSALAALDGRPRCSEGRFALPATAQERRWGTSAYSLERLSDCSLRRTYRIGTRMPHLGVAQRFAYESEDCTPEVYVEEKHESPERAACLARLADQRRARQAAMVRARGLLAAAIRTTEETLARSTSERAFAELASAYGKDNAVVAELRSQYQRARARCQQTGACATFGEPGVNSGRSESAVASDPRDAAIEQLREQGRYAEAVRLAFDYARAGVGRDPGVTSSRYSWRLARIALLDMGEVNVSLPALQQAAERLQELYGWQESGGGAPFLPSYHLERSEVAAAFRTLALGRQLAGERVAAEEALRKTCELGGCAQPLSGTPYSLVKEQAWVELALGRCSDAVAHLKELVRSAERSPVRDARWADAFLELTSASLTCGTSKSEEEAFRTLINESARLSAINVGESGASAGEALSRRLAYLLISWAQAKPGDAARSKLALDATLSLKGNLLTLQRDALRRANAAAARSLNQKLDSAYAPLSRNGLEAVANELKNPGKPFDWPDEPWRFRTRADALERERSRLAGIDGAAALGLGARVAAALGADQPLLEYVRYRPFDFRPSEGLRRWGPDRYALFVVRNGVAPVLFDIGTAAHVDAQVEALLDKIQSCPTCPKRGITLANGGAVPGNPEQDLYRLLLQPAQQAIGGAKDLYVSGDAAVWRVPFAALAHASGDLLLDRGFVFRYLPTSQELTRTAQPTPAKSLLAVGAPDFGPVRPGSLLQRFEDLPNTRSEVEGIAKLWRAASTPALVDVRLGAAASKAALRAASSPGVVHIATHGWYLPSSLATPKDTGLFLTPTPAVVAPPLVRTGLALAGANLSLDGTATALELSTLDWRNTQLVVLSACETGRGEVRSGEGVFGLSRSFLGAGAETVVSTLWSVGDEPTRELMLDYYARLLRGEDRVAALYAAARRLRGQQTRREPWFWAAFLAYGRGGRLRL